MVVQHNMQAMNSSRMLNITTDAQAKNTEKLSSGYKINRASDDAAGLSISEKMRKQVRGLDRASTNASDGVSSVQTAEGALNEVHSMLQRMNELCVQAANGTNSLSDRQAIQNEIGELSTEIDRIAETTKFNETLLLKGDNGLKRMYIDAHDAGLEGTLIQNTTVGTFTMTALEAGDKYTIGGTQYEIGASNNNDVANALNISYPEYKMAVKINWMDTDSKQHTSDYEIAVGDKITGVAVDGNTKLESKQYNVVAANVDTNLTDGNISVKDLAKYFPGDSKITTIDIDTSNTPTGLTDPLDPGATQKPGEPVTIPVTKVPYTKADGTTAIEDIIEPTGMFDLAIGDTITIDNKSYTISSNDDVANAQITSKKITELITTGSTVKYNGNSVTRFSDNVEKKEAKLETGADSRTEYVIVDKSKPSLVNAAQAYELVKIELKAASTIGATSQGAKVNAYYNDVKVTSNLGGVPSTSIAFTVNKGIVEVQNALTFNLHVGADADMGNKINVNIEAMNSKSLGIEGLNIADTTGKGATYAIDAIADALQRVSDQRAELGAAQNRLEHSIANLDNVVENTEAAESRIRDTDMADAMVEYSKNNILQQAGQSMLAQANQATQGVLSLLQ